MGFQPDYAIQLIRDDAAGTPQRFLFVSARDQYIPDVPELSSYVMNLATPSDGEVFVDREIQRLIGDRQRRVVRGEIDVDPLDSHRDLLQLKTALLLSVLCGSNDGVTNKWWNLARDLVDTSRQIRTFMLDIGKQRATDERVSKVHERLESEDMIHEHRMARIANLLGRHALSLGPSPAEKLINKLASRDRPHADIEDAVRRKFLVAGNAANQYLAGPLASK
jgi:hypothetical protein